ncbi:ferric reductase like transmembrane component-domain-containing protein [Vararia minispora EC-137]|uniref:Ferric reductase like transmembrane component-domain-containing protein n=1 Tax=Vararia minispora EC-137 TaxID=1314806 RepID=A0ACB8QI69_9AGAM|nr:ferric reductase like transmembrane component-domain-containing protein [Vararia minispora EC-137]
MVSTASVGVSGLPANVASPSTAATASASATPVVAVAQPVASFPFLFHVNVVIIVLFCIFFLSTLPRTIARLSHPSGRFKGFFLMSGGGSADVPPKPRVFEKTQAMESEDDSETRTLNNNPFEDGESASLNAHAPLVIGEPGTAMSGNAPARIPSLLSLTHPMVVAAVNHPVFPGFPVRKLAVLVIYFGFYLYGGLYRYNPFTTTPFRAGVVTVVHIPLAVLCVMKNNPISFLTGVAYEKLNYIHRFVGRLIVIAANAHALGWFFSWNPQGPAKLRDEFSQPFVRWGVVCLVCVDLLFVSSLPFVRRRAYGLFLTAHILGFIILVIGIHEHFPATTPYFIAAFVLYGFDHALRAARTRTTTAYIVAHPSLNGGSTQLIMPGLTTGWRAGQHVRMRLVDPSYPSWFALAIASVLSRFRARPFSIATRPGADGLELIVKRVGRSTSRLYSLAGGDERTRGEKQPADGDAEAQRELRRVTVVVEGPYSGPHTLFEAYSGVVLVAGGSGITYALSLLDDLLAKHAAGASHVRVLELVWSVADYAALTPLLPTLQTLLRPRPSPHGQLAVRVHVHYTRAARPGAPPPPAPGTLPTGLALLSGRPNYPRVLEDACDAVASTGGASGVAVTHCGPLELGDQIHRAVGSLSWERWKAVRGVEVHGETFGW